MECITTPTFLVMIDGEAKGLIHPQRSLRQGDPISLYIFLICAKGLSTIIKKAHESNRIYGISISPKCPSISHLLFVDDSLIFYKATILEIYTVKMLLIDYEKASGQKINFDKSVLCLSPNMGGDFMNYMQSMLGMRLVQDLGDYLGLPSSLSRSKSRDFVAIKDRLWKVVQGWKTNFFSVGGKEF